MPVGYNWYQWFFGFRHSSSFWNLDEIKEKNSLTLFKREKVKEIFCGSNLFEIENSFGFSTQLYFVERM